MFVLLTCSILTACIGLVAPHGRLSDPPQRSTMWRHGYGTPVNNDDNGLNCGGMSTQFNSINQGRCGVCGDRWSAQEKPNEAGGKFAKGIITKTYAQNGVMNVTVTITANHKGYFQLKICPHNSPSTPVQQACLDAHPLDMQTPSNGLSDKYYLSPNVYLYNTTVQLPAAITCSQCVLQWTYVAGNNWGCDGDDCGLGKGKQEHFVNCADIAITADSYNEETQSPVTSSTLSTSSSSTQSPTTQSPTTQSPNQSPTQSDSEPLTCRGVGPWKGVVAIGRWCQISCAAGHCPASFCDCGPTNTPEAAPPTCRAVGIWSTVPNMNRWCVDNCNHVPHYCPPSYCTCS